MKYLLKILALCFLFFPFPGLHADELQLNQLWRKTGADYTWLSSDATHNADRGMAYNPNTGHLLVAARLGGPVVRILDAETGDHVGDLDMTGVSGGTFPINKIGVADDGAIYVGNLTLDANSDPYILYRWADEEASPVAVFSGHPAGGTASPDHRFGDSIAVRGDGADTEILLGTWEGTVLGYMTPSQENLDEADSFSSQAIATSVLPFHGRNIAFGEGDVVYITRPSPAEGTPGHLYELELDTAAGTSVVLREFDGSRIARGIGAIGLDLDSDLFAGLRPFSHDIYAYLHSGLSNEETTLPDWTAGFGTSVSNGNGTGEVIVVGERIYSLNTNNGIMALELGPPPPPEPVEPGEIYWTNAGAIRTAEIDGGNPRTVLGGLTRAIGITIDPIRHHVYYADDQSGVIGRVGLDGLNPVEILTQRSNPQFLRVHGNRLYWAEWNSGLYAANLDGSEIEQLIDLGAGSQSTSVTVGNDGTVYLGTAVGALYRPTENPAEPEQVLSNLPGGTYGLAVHPDSGLLYGTSFGSNDIFSVDVDSGQQDWLNYGNTPLGIDVTRDGSQLVWAERTNGRIVTSGLEAWSPIIPRVTDEDSPFGVVVVPELADLPAGFEDWIAQFDLPVGLQGPEDDPDGDRIPNLLEYALDGHPAVAGSAAIPSAAIETDDGEDYLTLTVSRNPEAAGIVYVVEVSSDLQTWNSGEGHTVVLESTATSLIVRDATPVGVESRRFIRLRVDQE